MKETYIKPEAEMVELVTKESIAASGNVGWGGSDVDTDI